MFRISERGKVIAIAWATEVTPKVLEFHVACLPEYRGKWLTRRTIAHFFKVALSAGATHYIAQNLSPLVASIWKRLGASVFDNVMVLPLQENKYGRSFSPTGGEPVLNPARGTVRRRGR